MILVIMFIFVILLGFALMAAPKSYEWEEDINVVGAVMIVFGVALLIASFIIIIAVHATADNSIQKNKILYEGLCQRYKIVKSEYEDISKSDIIDDITAWNMHVYNIKYWSENPWTNWFNPKKVADNLNYISLDEESEVSK